MDLEPKKLDPVPFLLFLGVLVGAAVAMLLVIYREVGGNVWQGIAAAAIVGILGRGIRSANYRMAAFATATLIALAWIAIWILIALTVVRL